MKSSTFGLGLRVMKFETAREFTFKVTLWLALLLSSLLPKLPTNGSIDDSHGTLRHEETAEIQANFITNNLESI